MKQDWDVKTSFTDSVGTNAKTVTFPKTQESVKVTNQGNVNLTYAIGSKSGTLTPGQSITVNESLTSFTVTSASNNQSFEVLAFEAGTEKEETGGNVPSDVAAQLEQVKSDLADIVYFPESFSGATDKDKILNAISTLSKGSTLKLKPNKVYTVDSLTITKNDITIDGQGATINITDNTLSFKLLNCSNIVVKNLKVTMATTSRNYASGFWLENVTGFLLENNTIDGSNATGIICFNCDNGDIQNNLVQNTLADGIHMTRGSHDIRVYNNKTYNTGDDGIAVVSYQADTVRCKNIRAFKNTINNSKARGMTVVGGENVTYDGNIIDGTSCAGLYVGQEGGTTKTKSSQNVKFNDNELFNIGTIEGFGYPSAMSITNGITVVSIETTYADYRCSKVIIENNKVYSCGFYGIYLTHADDIEIRNNRIENIPNMHVYGWDINKLQLIDNKTYGSNGTIVGDGYNLSGVTEVKVQDNHIETVWKSGIYVSGDSGANNSDINVKGNSIKDCNKEQNATRYGVLVSKTNNVLVQDNELSGQYSLQVGFTLSADCTGDIKVFHNNVLATTTVTDIAVYSSNVKLVRNNKFSYAAMPTAGTYKKGDFVENTNQNLLGNEPYRYTIKGWTRLTNGSNHVLGTDWLEDKVYKGTLGGGVFLTDADGVATTYNIPHNLGIIPNVYSVMAGNATTGVAGIKYVLSDATNLIVYFTNPPASGANNTRLVWTAKI